MRSRLQKIQMKYLSMSLHGALIFYTNVISWKMQRLLTASIILRRRSPQTIPSVSSFLSARSARWFEENGHIQAGWRFPPLFWYEFISNLSLWGSAVLYKFGLTLQCS